MQINCKLLESDARVRSLILDALVKEIARTLRKSEPIIEAKIKPVVADALRSEPEYYSLTNGELRYEFGIPDVSNVDRVIDMLVDSGKMQIQLPTYSNMGIKGGFKYTMMGQQDVQSVINSSPGTVLDTENIYVLPWLQWLLLEGTRPLVRNYEVQLGPNPDSRTGYAVMVESEGSSWGVPPQFAGNSSNNWTTRAVEKCEKQILSIIQSTIESNI